MWQSSIHPFRRIVESVRRDRTFALPLSTPSAFTQLPRDQLRILLWNAQYTRWLGEIERSLPRCYPSRGPPPSIRELPSYLQVDPPAISAFRARLRFRRAHLAYNRARMKYPDTDGTCVQCGLGVSETTEHFLCHCPHPQYIEARTVCAQALASLHPPQTFSRSTVLWPRVPKDLETAVLTITGAFIVSMQKLRRF